MTHSDWIDRWQTGRTGWHQPQGNDGLQRHWHGNGERVLVPLCGKTPDLLWLARRGHDVVGVELSEIAIDAFFREQGLARERRSAGELTAHVAVDEDAPLRLQILQGDYFAFSATDFDACYDRAALVALPPDLRPKYVAHTNARLTADPARVVVTLEYDQSVTAGPPYAVHPDEVLGYWPDLERVETTRVVDELPPKFKAAGLEDVTQVVWRSPTA